jgi:hypothetical protein
MTANGRLQPVARSYTQGLVLTHSGRSPFNLEGTMQKKIIAVAVLWLGSSALVGAHECKSYETPLIDLLNQYSEIYETKFVIDPRVRANVNLVGVETEGLNSALLIGILNLHGFTALTKDGVVYVMPFPVAGTSGDMFGVRWDG